MCRFYLLNYITKFSSTQHHTAYFRIIYKKILMFLWRALRENRKSYCKSDIKKASCFASLLPVFHSITCKEEKNGADYGVRTRYLDLGKVALYQMS